jgi:small subunit ribosomal protein S6
VREYETTFVVQPEISDESCQDLCQRVNGVLERVGAIPLLHDDQGKRRLAYEIQKFQKGRYVTAYYLDVEGKGVAEIERLLRIEESILRFLTVLRPGEVTDIEKRKVEAAEEQRVRAERARERAAREAEEDRLRAQAREGDESRGDYGRDRDYGRDYGDEGDDE